MPDLTPAETLREAAETLRGFAAAATPGPWSTGRIGDHGWSVTSDVRPLVETDDSEQGLADALWVALMHPGFGPLIASWLEDAAKDAELVGPNPRALRLARAVISREQPDV